MLASFWLLSHISATLYRKILKRIMFTCHLQVRTSYILSAFHPRQSTDAILFKITNDFHFDKAYEFYSVFILTS